jgi:hypothetical protein
MKTAITQAIVELRTAQCGTVGDIDQHIFNAIKILKDILTSLPPTQLEDDKIIDVELA